MENLYERQDKILQLIKEKKEGKQNKTDKGTDQLTENDKLINSLILTKFGIESFYSGNYADAIEAFTEVIRLQPENHVGYGMRGRINYLYGDKEEAFNDFSEAIRLHTDESITYYMRSILYEEKEKLDLALIDIKKAIHLDPNYIEAYEFCALIYSEQEDWENVIWALTEAIRLKSENYTKNYCNRAVAYCKLGRMDEFVKDLEAIIRIEPTHFLAHMNLCDQCFQKKDYDNALMYATNAIKIDPTVARVYLRRANIFEIKNAYKDAIADLKQYCALGGDPARNSIADVRERIEYLEKTT